MGKQQKPKPQAKVSSNDRRANGKAPKKNPKEPLPATGRTSNGYSEAALARREARRANLSPLAPILKPGRYTKK